MTRPTPTHDELLEMPILMEHSEPIGPTTANLYTVFEDPADGSIWRADYWRTSDFIINTLRDGTCHIQRLA